MNINQLANPCPDSRCEHTGTCSQAAPKVRLKWSNVRGWLDTDTPVYDAQGLTWRRTDGNGLDTLYHRQGGDVRMWSLKYDTLVWLDEPPVDEPPDGTRLEIHHSDTDLYGAYRDDRASADAGWPVGDGGAVWCLYGSSVPITWTEMWLRFGESLRGATRLWPEEVPRP